MKKTICILLIAAAGSAGAAPRAAEPPQPLQRKPPTLTPTAPPRRAAVKPDIQPVKPVINATSNSTSGYGPGIGKLVNVLYAKNNGPGTLKSTFTWRLTCQVIAKEFPLGPCFYHSLSQAKNTQGAFPTVTASGAISNLPAAAGQQVWHQLSTSTYVNCRHDQGGKCYIKLEVDPDNKVAETNDANNEVNLVWQ